MIKKVFVGVFLAIVFGLLVFGAVNRTLAKTDGSEPLALSKNLSEENEGEKLELNLQENKNLSENKSFEKNLNQGGQGGQGSGQNLNDCDEGQNSDGSGYSRGSEAQGNGSGAGQGGQSDSAPADGLGTGLAEVTDNVTLSGTVMSITSDLMVIELSDGSQLEIEGRALTFMTEQGFSISEGNALSLEGFYEGDAFEVSYVENSTSGEAIRIREETGRPLWAGGYSGNQNH